MIGAIVSSRIGGAVIRARIVETEAYLGLDDPASHAYRGRRHAGNLSIYSAPATWYVYRSYGIHWCANLVTGPDGHGAAVLLRAVAVEVGLDVVRARRGGVPDRQLVNGPGKLCQALAIDREALDGRPMAGSLVEIGIGSPPGQLAITPRIGISKAVEWPLRFVGSV